MQTSTRPTELTLPYCEISRPKLGAPVIGEIVTDQLLLHTIHRDRLGRTIPCQSADCLFHRLGLPTEQRIFLPLFRRSLQTLCLLDLPSTHWAALAEAEIAYAKLDQIAIRATRLKRENGPIQLEFRPISVAIERSGLRPDVDAHILAITASNVAKALQDHSAEIFDASVSPVLNDRG